MNHGGTPPAATIVPMTEPADVPTTTSALPGSPPVSSTSAYSAPGSHAPPVTPPAPRTRPTLEPRRGREAAANPAASLVFPWTALHRQVVITGAVERVADAEADAYFAARPHGSKLGALASPQSQPIMSRAVLDQARAQLARR